MMTEDDILIERFLKDLLSNEEKERFYDRMENDAVFKEQVVLEQQLIEVLGETYWSFATNKKHNRIKAYQTLLESEETQELKSKISNAITAHKRELNKSGRLRIMKTVIGIAAVFMIVFSIFQYATTDTINYEALVEKAWNKNIGLDFTVRNSTTDANKITLNKALHLYHQKNYSAVLKMLSDFDKTNSHYKNALVLRALANYRTGKLDVTFKTLDTLDLYAPDISKWYKGLIHVTDKNLEKAALYLELPNASDEEIKLKP